MLVTCCSICYGANLAKIAVPSTASRNDDKAKALLIRTCEFYKNLPGLSGDVTLERISINPDFRQHIIHKFRFQSDKNDFFQLVMQQPNNRSQVSMRGGEAQIYSSKWHMDLKHSCASISEMLKNQGFNAVTEGCFGDSYLEYFCSNNLLSNLMAGVVSVSEEAPCRYAGTTCNRIVLHKSGADTRVWISTGDKPWIRRIEPCRDLPIGSSTSYTIICRYDKLASHAAPALVMGVPRKSRHVSHFVSQNGTDNPLLGTGAPAVKICTVSGKTINLASQRGKIVVLDFWATWCAPCRKSLPILSELADTLPKEVEFLAIDKMEEAKDVKAFVDSKKLNLRFCLDTNGKICELFHVAGIPQTVIIGRDGLIKCIHIGLSSNFKREIGDELRSMIAH
jgi:thiol-disulfide isomerase/thioredoxin